MSEAVLQNVLLSKQQAILNIYQDSSHQDSSETLLVKY